MLAAEDEEIERIGLRSQLRGIEHCFTTLSNSGEERRAHCDLRRSDIVQRRHSAAVPRCIGFPNTVSARALLAGKMFRSYLSGSGTAKPRTWALDTLSRVKAEKRHVMLFSGLCSSCRIP